MSLRFAYHLIRVRHPVVALGGRWVRPRPLVPVAVVGPSDSRLVLATLDTSADDTLFGDNLAALIGIDLTQAPLGTGSGVGSTGVPMRYAQVRLRLSDGREFRDWPAWVGFTPAQLTYPILGFAGCLQYFDATFHGDREEVELTVNSLYRGT
jgi:hypothetical protein